jgi:hypothetical protein
LRKTAIGCINFLYTNSELALGTCSLFTRHIFRLTRPIEMRGDERIQDAMFSYVSLGQRVPQNHPLRAVRKLTDTVLPL